MKYVNNYQCTKCHLIIDKSVETLTCPRCKDQGILDVVYDYQTVKHVMNAAYFEQPLDDSIWRYAPLLPVSDQFLTSTLKVGWTPLYESHILKDQLHLKKLYIKDEGVNPTASLKDRASVIAVIKALEAGRNVIACSSTGNAATSLAGNAARMGLQSVIFVPKRVPIAKLTQLQLYGAIVIKVDGDYKDAYNLSKKAIEHFGWYNRNAAINPHMVEGKKTVAFEIAEQLNFQPTDWVVVSVDDGCTIAGVHKGFDEFYKIGLIPKVPKLLGVQSDGCSPFVDAYQQNRNLEETEENTIADSIAVGIPRNPIKAMRAVRETNGTWIAVTDQEILKAMALLGKSEGIFGEPAGVASLAGVIKAFEIGIIKKHESVTMIMTGNGLKDIVNASKAVKPSVCLKPDLESLIDYMNTLQKEGTV
jgi:threonine synthase